MGAAKGGWAVLGVAALGEEVGRLGELVAPGAWSWLAAASGLWRWLAAAPGLWSWLVWSLSCSTMAG